MLQKLQVFNITKIVLLFKKIIFFCTLETSNWLISIINVICALLSNEGEAIFILDLKSAHSDECNIPLTYFRQR